MKMIFLIVKAVENHLLIILLAKENTTVDIAEEYIAQSALPNQCLGVHRGGLPEFVT